MPTLGWNRAYRSGDLVRLEAGRPVLPGPRRRSGQGRRPPYRAGRGGHRTGQPARRQWRRGRGAQDSQRHPLLVGYIASTDPSFDLAAARTALSESLPAALVPRLVLLDELPTRTSGKVDRNALPWPPPGNPEQDVPELDGTMGWLAGLWHDVLGTPSTGPRPTSSRWAAVHCPPRSWWRRCAGAIRW